ncbi:MAG: class I SAM-dependent methyltransferase [Mariprofundaceae bacterium]
MARVPVTQTVHAHLASIIQEGDRVVDATVGNGHDSIFLARTVGHKGHLYGFDIQENAIIHSLKNLAARQLTGHTTLLQKSHEFMDDYIPSREHGRIKSVVFNLGYLPGSDKSITTLPESTLSALNIALNLLSKDGIISILAYTGHPGGMEECNAVKRWAKNLPAAAYKTSIINLLPDHKSPPEWFLISRVQA